MKFLINASNLVLTPPIECGTNAKLFHVARTKKALPSFDLQSPHPHRKFDMVEKMLGGEVRILFTGERRVLHHANS
jgi:hypothetical protein